MRKLMLIAASLAITVSGCSRQPAATASSHPPALDLRCAAEPDALTEEQARADVDGTADRAFNDAAIIAGRDCRDTVARNCRWHQQRGMKVDCAAIVRPDGG